MKTITKVLNSFGSYSNIARLLVIDKYGELKEEKIKSFTSCIFKMYHDLYFPGPNLALSIERVTDKLVTAEEILKEKNELKKEKFLKDMDAGLKRDIDKLKKLRENK
jgi:hypothetical protein